MARRRILHPEEQELWRKVARSANPMHAGRPALMNAPQAEQPLVLATPKQPPVLPSFQLGQSTKPQTAAHVAPTIGDSLRAAPLRMDAKTHSKMTRGKLAPEARIDLHGMTVDQAHPALSGFIQRSFGAGMRLVLVITGKGGKAKGGFGYHQTGVLRRQVPHWLQLAPLSAMVLQVSEAHASHGGGGALYVYLRRH